MDLTSTALAENRIGLGGCEVASTAFASATIPQAHFLSLPPSLSVPNPRASISSRPGYGLQSQMMSQIRQGCKRVRQDGGNKQELVGNWQIRE